jgi:hypothetical protein
VQDSDYVRGDAGRSLTAWAGTHGVGTVLPSTGSSHATSNNDEIDMGLATFEAEITHYGLFDAETGGNLWAVFPLADSQPVGIGDPLVIEPAGISFALGLSGGLTNYGSNKLIDLIFRAEVYTWPANTYLAYTTSLPTNASPGLEPSSGTGYARAEIETSFTEWSGTDSPTSTDPSTGESGRMVNINQITFPVPTFAQGDAVGFMLMDAATGGNMLHRGPLLSGGLPASFTIVAGQAPRWDPGEYGVTVL